MILVTLPLIVMSQYDDTAICHGNSNSGIFGMEPCRVGITSHLAKLLTGGFPTSDHAVAFHQNTVVGKQVFDTSVVYL